MMKSSKSSAKMVWIYSAIAGACIGILWTIPQLLEPVLVAVPMLTMMALLLVGMFASKQTGRVRTGALASLVAGLTTEILLWAVHLLMGRGASLNLFSLGGAFYVMAVLGFSAAMGMLGGQVVQMMNDRTGSVKIVWTYGVICGVCLNIVWFVALYSLGMLGSIGSILAIILTLVALLLVGMLASKQTGRVRTGTQAGLVAGLAAGSIMCVTAVLVSLMSGSIPIHRLLNGLLNPSVLMGLAIAEAVLVVFLLSLGAGLGTLGGWIGKMKAKVPPAEAPMYSPSPLQQESLQYPLQQH